MMLKLEELEGRAVESAVTVAALADGRLTDGDRTVGVFEDWHGPLSVAIDGGRVYVGAGNGAGSRVTVLSSSTLLRVRPDFFAFEPSYRGGVSLAAADGRVYVGAGEGGGPVVVEYDQRTGAEMSRRLVGDEQSRAGVSDLAAIAVPVPGSFSVTPDPDRPPSAAGIVEANRELLNLTPSDVARLRSIGATVYLYSAFPVGGSYTHPDGYAYVNEIQGTVGITYSAAHGVVTHEVGHLIDQTLTAEQKAEWVRLWGDGSAFKGAYERTYYVEAFAESFRRYRMPNSAEPNPPGVDDYFTRTVGR